MLIKVNAFCVLMASVLCVCSLHGSGPVVGLRDGLEWVPGNQWRLHVKQYGRGADKGADDSEAASEAEEMRAQHEFDLTVSVLEPRRVAITPPGLTPGRSETLSIGRISIAASDSAPVDIAGKEFLLEVDLHSARAIDVKLIRGEEGGRITVEEAGSEKLILTNLFGFPVDWIIRAEDLQSIPFELQTKRTPIPKSQAELVKEIQAATTSGDKAPAIRVSAGIVTDASIGLRRWVIQEWVPGESWWRTFKRYDGARLDLEAELIRP